MRTGIRPSSRRAVVVGRTCRRAQSLPSVSRPRQSGSPACSCAERAAREKDPTWATAPAGRALGGSQPYFANDFDLQLGLVPGLLPLHETANYLQSLRTRQDSNLRLLPPEPKPPSRFSGVFPCFVIPSSVPRRAKVFGFARSRD